MNEYTFLTSNGYRTRHVHANSLRQAVETTMHYYQGKSKELAILGTIYFDQYQTCKPGNFTMSGWQQSHDKYIKGKQWSNTNQLVELSPII